MLWLAGLIAAFAVASGIWILVEYAGASGHGQAGAALMALFIPMILLLFAGKLALVHFSHVRIDRYEAEQRGSGKTAAGAMALRGILAAGVLFWFQRDMIMSALQPTGPLGETIPLSGRIFWLAPVVTVILLFGVATVIELIPEDRRPTKRPLVIVALVMAAIFVWAAYDLFTFVPEPPF